MGERRAIRLDDHDLIAGAQILGWIALPHRPHDGANLMQQWYFARRRHRGQENPALPFDLKKPNRLAPQLVQFEARCLDAFRAGLWFDKQIMRGPNVIDGPIAGVMSVSIHRLAAGRMKAKGIDPVEQGTGNAVRDIWSKRKPVAHLASALGMFLVTRSEREGQHGFDLERTVFDPVWIDEVLERAENRARHAIISGAVQPAQLHRFHRDSF